MNKQEIKERISPKTTPKGWAKVRNVAGIVAGIGGIIISPVCPIAFGATFISWAQFVTAIAGTVATTSHLTKK